MPTTGHDVGTDNRRQSIAAERSSVQAVLSAGRILVVDDFEANLILVTRRRDGFDACRERQSSTPLIPVVLITALQNSQDEIRGIQTGADDFLAKPVNPHELHARVRSLLRIKRYTDDLDSARAPDRATITSASMVAVIPPAFAAMTRCSRWGENGFIKI